MLVFTFDCDIYGEAKEKLKKMLEDATGEECIVLSFCSGVYRVPLEEERLNKSCQSNKDRQNVAE